MFSDRIIFFSARNATTKELLHARDASNTCIQQGPPHNTKLNKPFPRISSGTVVGPPRYSALESSLAGEKTFLFLCAGLDAFSHLGQTNKLHVRKRRQCVTHTLHKSSTRTRKTPPWCEESGLQSYHHYRRTFSAARFGSDATSQQLWLRGWKAINCAVHLPRFVLQKTQVITLH